MLISWFPTTALREDCYPRFEETDTQRCSRIIQGHTAGKQQSQELNQGSLAARYAESLNNKLYCPSGCLQDANFTTLSLNSLPEPVTKAWPALRGSGLSDFERSKQIQRSMQWVLSITSKPNSQKVMIHFPK